MGTKGKRNGKGTRRIGNEHRASRALESAGDVGTERGKEDAEVLPRVREVYECLLSLSMEQLALLSFLSLGSPNIVLPRNNSLSFLFSRFVLLSFLSVGSRFFPLASFDTHVFQPV